MKKHYLLLFLHLLTSALSQAQTARSNPSYLNQFRISLGLGYEDGLIYLASVPAFGLSYERVLSKRISLASHLLIYYRTLPDSYTQGVNGKPVLDQFRGTNSPFLTPTQRQELENAGIKALGPTYTVKFMSVPMDVGVIVYPICRKKHRLGVNLAGSVTYEVHNWFRDIDSGVLTLKDGTKHEISLSTPTEYRNLSAGINLKLVYDYRFKDYALGLRTGGYNVFFSDWFDANNVVWETSVFFGFQF